MKKKILIGAVALIVNLVLLSNLTSCTSKNKYDVNNEWEDNTVTAWFSKVDEKSKAPDSSRIYLEVSYSMKGYYVGDKTKMTNVVTDIKNLDSKNTKLFFWGNEIEKQGHVHDVIKSAAKSETGENTSTFHDKFANMIETVKSTKGLTYLVTDGIMSLGKPGKNMESYIKELKGKISSVFKDKDDIAVAIYRHIGDFDGEYTNCMEQSKIYTMERPFYVIAIGKKANIRWLQQQNLNAENSLFIGTHDYDGHLDSARLERVDSNNKERILPLYNQEDNTKDFVVFSLKMTESLKGIKSESIKLLTKGEEIPATNVTIDVESDRIKATLNDYKYQVEDKSENGEQYKSVTMIGLVNTTKYAKWDSDYNCDSDIQGPDSTTTFGLKSLIKGIKEGLEPNDTLFKANFKYKPYEN